MDVSNTPHANRPAQMQPNGMPSPYKTTHAGGDAAMPHKKKMWGKTRLALIVAVVVLVAALAVGGYMWRSGGSDAAIKQGQYQAVFLTNSQVYFGKLKDVNAQYITLTDIYYLQVQQSVQPADAKDAKDQTQVSLAKLGGELHGPEDNMQINRDQVLFWENLKGDSQVAKAIKDYKSK